MQSLVERSTIESHGFDYEQRRYYDTVTWLAEVLPGGMRTPFEYSFDGQELYASDGSRLGDIFDDSIRDCAATYGTNGFEYRRVLLEKEEYHDMIAMMGDTETNTMVVVSDFPAELMSDTKDRDGYNVSRKQTMLRVLTKTPEGTLKMYSQSLDGSERAALEAIYGHLGLEAAPGELLGQRMHKQFDVYEQEFLVDELMGVYDRSLQARYGGEWHAGRGDNRRNTYDFVCQQTDLIEAYLATTHSFTGGRQDYGLAAAMEARFLARTPDEITYMPQYGISTHALALHEMDIAANTAQAAGKSFSGCGLTSELQAEAAISQLEEAGYGAKAGEDKYGSRTFQCKYGHWNKRPHNQMITKCRVATCKKGSVGC